MPEKRAILLVAHGTSVPKAQASYERVHARVEETFPDLAVRWAYTLKTVRARRAEQGDRLDSPVTALARLMDDGYTHVAVLPLHVIPGIEFHDLNRNAQLFAKMAGGLTRIEVARPLLSSHEDRVRVAKALLERAPAGSCDEDVLIYVGHGSEKHPSDAIYTAMNYLFQELSCNVYVGTVGGYPQLEDLLPRLTDRKFRKVFLIPFITLAGTYAYADVIGDGPDSWKSVLTRHGFACETILSGMIENPQVVRVWVDHLRAAFLKLES